MKLKNLQMQFNGKGYLEHRITYVNENDTQCRETLCSGEEFAQHVIDCLEAVPPLRDALKLVFKERDEFFERVSAQLQIPQGEDIAYASYVEIFESVKELRYERDALRDRPDTTQPQLSEIRYVLHGDIQPCSVLYSDDTTTLLRLDEGDMMLETDTIEWSGSVTYRCQELLRGTGVVPSALHRCSVALSQLVRDERILLNDDAVTGVDEAYFRGESTSGVEPEVRFVEPADAIASIVGSTVAETVTVFSYARYVEECSEYDAHPMDYPEWELAGRPHFTPKQRPASAEAQIAVGITAEER